jgi:hypothetical protein
MTSHMSIRFAAQPAFLLLGLPNRCSRSGNLHGDTITSFIGNGAAGLMRPISVRRYLTAPWW